MTHLRLFNALVISVLIVGIVLVALAVATVKALDRLIIEEAAARHRHAEFLRAAAAVGRALVRAEDVRKPSLLDRVLNDILELRPGIRSVEVLALDSGRATSVISKGAGRPAGLLTAHEVDQIEAGHVVSHFDDAADERAWLIAAPIRFGASTIGAIRGRFSISKYDALIVEQRQVAKIVGIGAIVVTSIAFLVLIRIQVHRPIARLLETMEQVGSGQLALQAPVVGPVEISRLARTFNDMLRQIQEGIREKEALVHEIRRLNSSLQERVASAVSNLDEANRKLVKAQIEAERNEKLAALGEMSAVMAHELGNPLNAISGRLQLIDAATDLKDHRRHLQVVRSEIDRMTTVIRHILHSTRVEAAVSSVDMNEVIREVLALLPPHPARITTDLRVDVPGVAINRASLHGLVLNLVTNALQAMEGGGELGIVTRLCRDEALLGHVILQGGVGAGPLARLIVKDTGPGVPEEFVRRMFEPFVTTRQEQGGTGLGLAICRRTVASVGGRLAVETAAGKGTAFTIDLPLWGEQTRCGDG
ncbi:ATP-binding protein [Candidatus Nitrospira bockiana]